MRHSSTSTSLTSTVNPVLRPASILDKALDGQLISRAEALILLQLQTEDDLAQLQEAADTLRRRQVGENVLYETGFSLFLTNQCQLAPRLYPYPKAPGDAGLMTLTIDDIDAQLDLARYRKVQRLYLSGGGFWPYLQIPGLEAPNVLKTYARLLTHIQAQAPTLKIHGFSPDEIEFLCILSDRSDAYVLELLADHGLRSLGGQGTEILDNPVRHAISPRKATVKRWFEIVAAAHCLQLPVEAALEAGPLETGLQRARHLELLRDFQQKYPGAFNVLVPRMWVQAPAQPISQPEVQGPLVHHTDRFKLIAVARLMLGNVIANQQVFWLPDRVSEAQECLQWGANHLGGTDALAYSGFLSDSQLYDVLTEPDCQALITAVGRPAVLA